jgi:sugar phosphate isomerase/epimerase
MKLAFSTNAFTRKSVGHAIDTIAQAGFDGVELLMDRPHLWPGDVTKSMLLRVLNRLEKTGLAVSNLNANCSFAYFGDAPPEPFFEPSLISPIRRYRQDRIRLVRQTLRLARVLGAANISITSGRCLAGMPPAKAARQFAESIDPILMDAEKLGVDVGIECEPGLLIEYVDELVDWIDRLGSKRLGANLDLGHCQVIGENVGRSIRKLKSSIWNMHIEDIPGRKHYHMIPGEGSMEWGAIGAACRAIRYDRFLTVELYTHTANPEYAAKKSHRFLKTAFGSDRRHVRDVKKGGLEA